MIVVVGDVLLDVDIEGRSDRMSPDAPVPVLDVTAEHARPGGAGLAAALLAAGGEQVTLVAALHPDPDGERLRAALGDVRLIDGPGSGATAVKTRLRAEGRPLLRVDRGQGRPTDGFGSAVLARLTAALEEADAVLVSDYGRGVPADPRVRTALACAAARGVPIVWDPHPRGEPPVPGIGVVTPNGTEAAAAAAISVPMSSPMSTADGLAAARALVLRWGCGAVAVTLGERGAVVGCWDGSHFRVDAPAVSGGDPCGAGDAFAGRLAAELAHGRPVAVGVREAVQTASAFVASGGAGGFATRMASMSPVH
ncbi:MAG: D-beta-D-heptose 7-phosphate kinase / D-beta-D-heptose 1-phosphate adenosyltransferase [Pseudonocardiales bacterium]|nr:D-beta-D-heptose 7-phosphate kinase / D-beta-D-heptose 1-phosphate adenosyltransferase [Pseudonocardiales bacterium]